MAKAAISAVRLKAQLLADEVSVRLQSPLLAAQTSYVLAQAKAQIGTFLEFLEVVELAAATDLASLEVGKYVADISNAVDTIARSVQKIASDQAQASDHAVRLLQKVVVEQAIAGDTVAKSFSKMVADNASIADRANYTFTKSLRDALDSIVDVTSKDVSKSVSDLQATTDFLARQASKPLLDTSIANDSRLLIPNKVFNDPVNTTEFDFFSLQKLVLDSALPADHRAIATTKPVTTDSAQASDIKNLSVGKSTGDFVSSGDLRVALIGKVLIEVVTPTDDFNGQADADDEQTIQFTKLTNDQAIVSDSLIRVANYYRSYTDTSFTSDAVDTKAFNKAVFDVVNVSDVFDYTKTAPKQTSDVTSVTDAGSLRSQGYVAFDYLAEDYVGASRTF